VNDRHRGRGLQRNVFAADDNTQHGVKATGNCRSDPLFCCISAINPLQLDIKIAGGRASGKGTQYVCDGVIVADAKSLCGWSPDGQFRSCVGSANNSQPDGLSCDV
jgi:hypothetical protein